MIFGIVVEGAADAVAYSALITRIRPAVQEIVRRPCGGKTMLAQKFVGYLKEFQWKWQVDKALVIRHSDCRDAELVELKMEEKLHKSGFIPPYPVHFYATRCMLETWLIADEHAINQVAQHRGKQSSAQPVADPLEGKNSAKDLFRRMLSQAWLPADPAVYAEVAAAADIDRIRRRCPSFRHFHECVLAC